jgi:hypothetical protein
VVTMLLRWLCGDSLQQLRDMTDRTSRECLVALLHWAVYTQWLQPRRRMERAELEALESRQAGHRMEMGGPTPIGVRRRRAQVSVVAGPPHCIQQ